MTTHSAATPLTDSPAPLPSTAVTTEGTIRHQRRLWVRAYFGFGDSHLVYHLHEAGNLRRFSVAYSDIPYEDFGIQLARMAPPHYWVMVGLGLSVFLLASIQLAEVFPQWATLVRLLALSLLMVVVCTLFSYAGLRGLIRYTVIDTPRGPLRIVQDGQHDTILSEIDQRRKQQWHALYAHVDEDADPRDELRKIDWLLARGAISREEYWQLFQGLSRVPSMPTVH